MDTAIWRRIKEVLIMIEYQDISVKPISNYDLLSGTPIPAIDRLKIISPSEYEECIAEWCVEYLDSKYETVKRRGGSGDQGQDINAFYKFPSSYDQYQCKHYNAPLSPSDIWLELGKLCYYIYIKKFTKPQTYYFVSPMGVGQKLTGLIAKPNLFANLLLDNWNKYCSQEISKNEIINLDDDLRSFILNFDFSIIRELSPFDFIEQFKQTRYFVVRFGGGLVKFRDDDIEVPIDIHTNEIVYITELLKAYSDFKQHLISTTEDLQINFPELYEHLIRQRRKFHSAEALQRFVRDSIPGESIYSRLQKDFYDGLYEIVCAEYKNGYERLQEVLKEAARIQISNIISRKENFKFSIDDRGGICHQLVNEGKIKWVK
jgi:hypothetical protein